MRALPANSSLMSALGGDLNRSMQYLVSKHREEEVVYEAAAEDLLQLRAKKLDVGSLVER